MLKKGYLANNAIYVCTEHKVSILDDYKKSIEPIFSTIGEIENSGEDPTKLLKGPICHEDFKRLN